MGVGEENTALGQPVYIGRFCVWMAVQAPDPVIQIINGDEEDVGFRRSSKRSQW